ncbi:uncharacterized protein BJX67DRAFT_352659 [Aspergillus lucknowensis]|uniref:Calpain catalytic domain-containing protein n=1 Tax=Aspergillus lucknowensis TaxID=176173 RepID=A0ABR4LST2_9EURO
MQYIRMATDKLSSSDPAPNDLAVGVINPYAMVEALLNRRIRWNSPESAKVISDTLQTDYDELFDMNFNSVLHAGLRFNDKENAAERLSGRDIHILTGEDMETPPLSRIERVDDLHDIGLKEIGNIRVKHAWIQNGKVKLVLNPEKVGDAKRLSNTNVTESIAELATPFRREKKEWSPPTSSWQHMERALKRDTEFNEPVQGAVGNSWLIAALSAVAWSDPARIEHRMRRTGRGEHERVMEIQFYSKGGNNDAPTRKVEVTDDLVTNDSYNQLVYARSSDNGEIWPSLYEKAYAKWITRDSSDHPDVTQTAFGDPVKAMAQLNDKNPHYYFTRSRDNEDLAGIVRANSFSFRTINPMAAWTYGSTKAYEGSNLVSNHAYAVLGWATQGENQYIILRNPFGVTEPAALSTYPGLRSVIDARFWSPIDSTDDRGVFALEASAFKNYFAGLGVAK